jgi:hypothetical protein
VAAAQKVITVIVPQGQGIALLEQLYAHNALRAALGTARAPFAVTRKRGGISRTEYFSVEKDVLNVVVEDADADHVFAFLYEAARIREAHGGFMFQGPATQASAFTLPADLPRP